MPHDPRAPDGHPRRDTVAASERGYNARLRSALALLSSGVGGKSPLGSDAVTITDIQIESPEQRVLRVAFELSDADRALGNGNPCMIALCEGNDGAVIRRSYVAPLQGLSIAVPAGITRVTLTSSPTFAVADTATPVYAYLSRGVLARRWYRDHLSDVVAVPAFPLTTPVAAPVYATHARVTVLSGALAEPVAGAPVWLAGSQPVLAPDEYGLLTLTAGAPSTVVSIEWEISE